MKKKKHAQTKAHWANKNKAIDVCICVCVDMSEKGTYNSGF